jgi:hypothetical protein
VGRSRVEGSRVPSVLLRGLLSHVWVEAKSYHHRQRGSWQGSMLLSSKQQSGDARHMAG